MTLWVNFGIIIRSQVALDIHATIDHVVIFFRMSFRCSKIIIGSGASLQKLTSSVCELFLLLHGSGQRLADALCGSNHV